MKINLEQKEEFLNRRKKLHQTKKQLKNEFVGLDNIIEELVTSVEPWYIFPKNQVRPTVVNLWGMTGVGKSSLVERLIQLLEINSLFKFDIGEYDNNKKLSYEFSNKLSKVVSDEEIPVLVFDEFQLGRTINEMGNEINKSRLRIIWDLLDKGKVFILEENFFGNRVYWFSLQLEELLQNIEVEVKDGIVVEGIQHYDRLFGFKEKNKEESSKKQREIIPFDIQWRIIDIWDGRFFNEMALTEYIKTLTPDKIKVFIEDTIEKAFRPVEKDFSDTLIFVIGNLDECYTISSDLNPDMDADFLHDFSNKITLTKIKKALSNRYRAEQISRLGNNHIIYPAFNRRTYQDLINLEINKIKHRIKERFDLIIEIEESVKEIIYLEGVFPTQGVRPVFSTINNLIECYIGRIINDIILEVGEVDKEVGEVDKEVGEVDKIRWQYINGQYLLEFQTQNRVVLEREYEVNLKVDSLRKSLDDDRQSLVGIHEAGHIITAIYATEICPKHAFSKTANNEGGFTFLDLPDWKSEKLMRGQVVLTMGGYEAEKLIFGEENISSGSVADIAKATMLVNDMLKEYGMCGESPTKKGSDSYKTSETVLAYDLCKFDQKAENIINECAQTAKKILNDNYYLLLKMGKYLTQHNRIDEEMIKEMVTKYAQPPNWKTKNNYLNYKKILNEKLKSFTPKKEEKTLSETFSLNAKLEE
jgi:hypothetical protein